MGLIRKASAEEQAHSKRQPTTNAVQKVQPAALQEVSLATPVP